MDAQVPSLLRGPSWIFLGAHGGCADPATGRSWQCGNGRHAAQHAACLAEDFCVIPYGRLSADPSCVVGATQFEELICWQLADELKMWIYRIISRPRVADDVEFCRQIRKSSRSAPALIAERFGRWTRPEFRRYLQMAMGELGETRNHLRDGAQSNHLSVEEYRGLWHLCYRTTRACRALVADLDRKIAGDKERRRNRKP
jgi:four helix bundle protein